MSFLVLLTQVSVIFASEIQPLLDLQDNMSSEQQYFFWIVISNCIVHLA